MKAKIVNPSVITFDSGGRLYYVDNNLRVRRINLEGKLETVAGSGERGAPVDGEPALTARFQFLSGLAVNERGEVFLADDGLDRLYKIGLDGRIQALAGTGEEGYSGDGGRALSAMLWLPRDLSFDATGGLLFIDSNGKRVRRVSPEGTLSTVYSLPNAPPARSFFRRRSCLHNHSA